LGVWVPKGDGPLPPGRRSPFPNREEESRGIDEDEDFMGEKDLPIEQDHEQNKER
jgi:hypothetical protein